MTNEITQETIDEMLSPRLHLQVTPDGMIRFALGYPFFSSTIFIDTNAAEALAANLLGLVEEIKEQLAAIDEPDYESPQLELLEDDEVDVLGEDAESA